MTLRGSRSREVLAELVPDARAVFSDAMVSVSPNIRRIFVVDPDRHDNDSDSFVSISEIVTFDECRRRMRAGMPADDAQSHASNAGKLEDDGDIGRWPIPRRYPALKDTWADSALRWIRRRLASTRRSKVVDEEVASSMCYRAPSVRSSDIESSGSGYGTVEEMQRANSSLP